MLSHTGLGKFLSLQKYPVAIVENILSMDVFEGRVQLNIQNCLFNL